MAEEKYLKQYEKSATGNYLLRSRGTLENVISVGAAKALVQEESGSLVGPSGAARTITLPAIKAGLNFKFIAGSAHAHVITGGASLISGFVYDNTNGTTLARTAIAAKTTITLVNPLVGDVLNFHCDGAKWLVEGVLNQTPTLA